MKVFRSLHGYTEWILFLFFELNVFLPLKKLKCNILSYMFKKLNFIIAATDEVNGILRGIATFYF